MFFFKKNKKIKIRALTFQEELLEMKMLTPTPVPDWLKKLPMFLQDTHIQQNQLIPKYFAPTAKVCPALHDLFDRSLMISLWCDHLIHLTPMGNVHVATTTSLDNNSDPYQTKSHPRQQFKGAFNDQGLNVKFMSPYKFVTDSDCHFTMIDAVYHRTNYNTFTTLPGIINFKDQQECDVNTIFPLPDETSEILLHYGTPMSYLLPLDNVDIEINTELVTVEEYFNKKKRVKFVGNYNFVRKQRSNAAN